MDQIESFRIVATEVPFEHEYKDNIYKTFFAVSDYYKINPRPGACHLISSILHVLLKEQKIENDLCIGEVMNELGQFFDHSWIEIDGKVFDIAIQQTLQNDTNPAVYAGYNLETGNIIKHVYGVTTSLGLDPVAQRAIRTPFVQYLNEYPDHRIGAWHVIKIISEDLQLTFDLLKLKNKYSGTKRKLISKKK